MPGLHPFLGRVRKSVSAVPLLMAIAWAVIGVPSGAADLKAPSTGSLVGKPAPELRVGEWIKGAPLDRFEPGRIYVVDLWATWCGPCRAAIPHLTRLARKYPGEVEVIGVSISERQDSPEDRNYISRVKTFVSKMGDQMDYRVAVDRPDHFIHTTWYKTAGTAGIPTAYVIDRKGRVAWVGIGTPKEVERIVEEVRAGTFDHAKEVKRQQQEEAAAKDRSAADRAAAAGSNTEIERNYPGYQAAMKRGDLAAAIASLDAAFASRPELEVSGAYQWKLMALMQRNQTNGVNAYAADLVKRHGTNDNIMSFLSACIVATGEEARFDTALALVSAQRAAAMATPESRWAQFTEWRLGWAYWHRGRSTEALQHIKAAREGIRRLKGRYDFGDLEIECDEAVRFMQGNPK